ncbi:molybdate ABC transporter substrate-binding protein [Roseomonas fluvialis]|uniref:Molybdate ABC transporter substrate-binding protein n=1 Tax=Roseomonas fluvialis TaxID=1750527 RepID=A0ABM7XZW9_9PROT|nr:substrate-binding domain-containing protein [Roseomonas fluvialis]BDG71056.1 molybdate ABC transporter substrate-binding protein [Roseomonas fluvialis]
MIHRRILVAGLCAPALARAQATPVRVLGTGAVAASVRDLAGAFAARGGREVLLATANAGVAARRLREGEAADLMLNSADQVARLTADALLDGTTTRELGRMLIGVAVRAGAAHPDISTEAALRAAILAAPMIAHSDPATGATAGTHAARLVERLGIADQMRTRTLVFPGGGAAVQAVAESRAALALTQVSEIIAVPGAVLVGPLPDSAQLVTPYLGAVATRATDRAGAAAFLSFLTGPEGQARFRAAGFAVG